MTPSRAVVGALLLTALLLAGEVADAPAWARTPVALLVFLAAPGAALVAPVVSLPCSMRWSLIVGLSLTVDFLGAVLLLALGAFSIHSFLVLLLALEASAGAALLFGDGRARAGATAGEPR